MSRSERRLRSDEGLHDADRAAMVGASAFTFGVCGTSCLVGLNSRYFRRSGGTRVTAGRLQRMKREAGGLATERVANLV
jgi:hypothetical protein